jgi:rhomboid protease GluP
MPRLKDSPVTTTILALIAVVFGIELFLNAPKNDDALVAMGAIIHGTIQNHEYWRLLAAMFLHANWIHWLVNSWALYQLGSLYEAMFGKVRFAIIYFVTGLCASFGSAMNLSVGGASVGASGAIFGILGAFIFSIRRSQWRHEPWTRGLTRQLVFWGLLNLAVGASFAFIDNTAHIAGLVSGLLLGLLLPHRVPPPPPGRHVIDVQPYDDSPMSPRDASASPFDDHS